MKRDVGAELEVEISAPTTLEFQIAVAPHPGTEVSESLTFSLDGTPVQAAEIIGVHGNRIHKMDVPVGLLSVAYTATVLGRTGRLSSCANNAAMKSPIGRQARRAARPHGAPRRGILRE